MSLFLTWMNSLYQMCIIFKSKQIEYQYERNFDELNFVHKFDPTVLYSSEIMIRSCIFHLLLTLLNA